jgi:hypothetical protein
MNHKLLAAVSITSAFSALAFAATLTLDPPKDMDVGVYITDGSEWLEAPVEIVNWKTGGVVKNAFTDGIVKGDLNGLIRGESSLLELPRSTKRLEVLIHTVEGTSAEEYQLVRLRTHSDSREFRSVTGGVFHVSGGATRDAVPFKFVRVAPRLWKGDISDLPRGEYGFIPPVYTHSLAGNGKIYSFRMGSCERCAFSPSSRPNDGLKAELKGLFLNTKDRALDFH